MSGGAGKNGTAGGAVAKKARDAGLVVARNELSHMSEIFALPPKESEERLLEWARKEHDAAKQRAREQIRRILDSE